MAAGACGGVVMKEKPIIFSAEMIRAIQDGRKTMTRRVVKPQPTRYEHGRRWGLVWGKKCGGGTDWMTKYCPHGQPGDRLWVIQGAGSWAGQSPEQRFWSRVIKTEGCWEWYGRTNRKKYGYMKVGQRLWWVHRYSWSIHNGEIPSGLHVLHRCDLPWCVNPEHIYLGDNDQNIADKVARGRTAKLPGEANGQAKLSQRDIAEIRRLHLEEGVFQKDLAAQFGVGQPQVSRIVSGKRWTAGEASAITHRIGSRTLEITDVRVERVQEISEDDARAEGVEPVAEATPWGEQTPPYWFAFMRLWHGLNAKRGYGWDANPWVWVIEFRVLEGANQ